MEMRKIELSKDGNSPTPTNLKLRRPALLTLQIYYDRASELEFERAQIGRQTT